MLALGLERFFVANRHDFTFCLDCRGNSILPLDLVGIEDKLLVARVIKDGHFLRTNHHQPLLFERMQPTDEDMCLHAARKTELTQRYIENMAVQIGSPLAGHLGGTLVEQRKHYRNIMRRKTPEDV